MRPGVNVKWPLAFLVVAAWSGLAEASTTFPAAVDQALMLSGADTVENKFQPPNMGCLLCHVTPAGGDGTNNTFGSALKRAGAVGGNPNTVGPALSQLESQTPRAIDDIEMGVNPNDDPESLQGLPPQPLHGCSVGASGARHEEAWCASLVALALLAVGRFRGPNMNRASRADRRRR
jgi:hypothetical protein